MRYKYPDIAAAFLTGIILLFSSCTPGSCFEDTNASVKAIMYQTASGKIVAPDSVTLYGMGMDTSKIYKRAASIRKALLPLNDKTGSSTFVMKINGIYDTLTVEYTSFPYLISKECGYTYYHNIEGTLYTRHVIDTVIVRKRTVTTLNEENIHIYY
jgi:hypothetical protein